MLHNERRGTPLLSGAKLQKLFEDAGFVDIQVVEKLIDYGTYTNGLVS